VLNYDKLCKRCGQVSPHRYRGDAPHVLRWACNDCLASDSGAYRASSWLWPKLRNTYRAMIARCTDPLHESYGNYGGRGVRVCKRWLGSYAAFRLDVGHPPSPEHTLDRVRVSRGYSRKNVRWATLREQAQNRRTSRLVTLDGEAFCVAAWARKLGLKPSAVRARLYRGWSVERALGRERAPLYEPAPF